jgi:hypothetical protein
MNTTLSILVNSHTHLEGHFCLHPSSRTTLKIDKQAFPKRRLISPRDIKFQNTTFKSCNFPWRNSLPPPPPVGQGLFIKEVSRSHSDTPHSVGIIWTSIQPDTETSTWQHTTFTKETCMHLAGFKTAIPESERQQTQALDRAAAGIGILAFIHPYFLGLVGFLSN